MPRAVWTPLAEAELEEIVFHIAIEDGRPLTAERIATDIRDRANWFAANSEAGHRNEDFPLGWFYFLHKRWLVLYQSHEEGIEVLRVVDATRDLQRLLSP